ncbi:MAG: 3-phosphoshikimate 1-carboxyvinyltransferase [Peptococcaceae bacterium]|nr:3-phosphoshikimate 1-carboxyvinyltransferase [Peptococcaceae bacterium]
MIATFKPCQLAGNIDAPPSKSMAHRYLIGAALSKEVCVLSGIDYSEDILASIDCLKALGAKITIDGDNVRIEPQQFMQVENPVLECRESGSTLRFFIPLALCLGKTVTLRGSQRLLQRPLDIYEELCQQNGFIFEKTSDAVTVCGKLKSGEYKLKGDVSSQFITGLIFALIYLGEEALIEIIPPFESRSYINLIISALKSFGAEVEFIEEYKIKVSKSAMHSYSGRIEGDYSNAAFLDAFNYLDSEVIVGNLNSHSLQGDRVYKDYFKQISEGSPTLDISDCPDLGPVLFALAAMKNGAVFTGTERLKAKESDRGLAMHEELQKLGGGLIFGNNMITVPQQELQYSGTILSGHNDHRIVMAMSVVLTQTGGSIDGAEAIKKSYPGFFTDIKKLGAEVETI